MYPVASLMQRFSKGGVGHRKQAGSHALPEQHLLLPLLETGHLATTDGWSDPAGHFVRSCATGGKLHGQCSNFTC